MLLKFLKHVQFPKIKIIFEIFVSGKGLDSVRKYRNFFNQFLESRSELNFYYPTFGCSEENGENCVFWAYANWKMAINFAPSGERPQKWAYVRTCFSGDRRMLWYYSQIAAAGQGQERFLPDLGASPCRWPFTFNIYVSSVRGDINARRRWKFGQN